MYASAEKQLNNNADLSATRGRINKMTIYINGVKATAKDIATLQKRCRAGLDKIVSVHMTERGNCAIVTV